MSYHGVVPSVCMLQAVAVFSNCCVCYVNVDQWIKTHHSIVAAVHYSISNEDKSRILKESPKSGAEFVLQEGVAVPAIPLALKTMKMGEKASLIIKPGCALLSSVHAHNQLELIPLASTLILQFCVLTCVVEAAPTPEGHNTAQHSKAQHCTSMSLTLPVQTQGYGCRHSLQNQLLAGCTSWSLCAFTDA